MQKIRVFLFFFLVFFIHNEIEAKSRKKSSYNNYVMQIAQRCAKQVKDDLNLEMSGKRVSTNGKIEEFEMYFRAGRKATLQEARTLQLLAMNKLVDAINDHKGIQPYLIETPFTFRRVRISINFDGPLGRYYDGTVTYMHNVTDCPSIPENSHCLFYCTADPLTEKLIDFLKEPYEEALSLAEAFPIKNPQIHQTTELEEASDQVFYKFGKELSEKHTLYLESVGSNLAHNDLREIRAKFLCYSRSSVDEARKLALLAIEKIYYTVNQDQKLKPYLNPYPCPLSGLNIVIEFKKLGKSPWGPPPYLDGTMHSVEIKDGVLSYYISPEIKAKPKWEHSGIIDTNPFLCAKETYQEALEAARNTHLPSKKRR